MKISNNQTYPLLVFLLILAFGCKKSNDELPVNINSDELIISNSFTETECFSYDDFSFFEGSILSASEFEGLMYLEFALKPTGKIPLFYDSNSLGEMLFVHRKLSVIHQDGKLDEYLMTISYQNSFFDESFKDFSFVHTPENFTGSVSFHSKDSKMVEFRSYENGAIIGVYTSPESSPCIEIASSRCPSCPDTPNTTGDCININYTTTTTYTEIVNHFVDWTISTGNNIRYETIYIGSSTYTHSDVIHLQETYCPDNPGHILPPGDEIGEYVLGMLQERNECFEAASNLISSEIVNPCNPEQSSRDFVVNQLLGGSWGGCTSKEDLNLELNQNDYLLNSDIESLLNGEITQNFIDNGNCLDVFAESQYGNTCQESIQFTSTAYGATMETNCDRLNLWIFPISLEKYELNELCITTGSFEIQGDGSWIPLGGTNSNARKLLTANSWDKARKRVLNLQTQRVNNGLPVLTNLEVNTNFKIYLEDELQKVMTGIAVSSGPCNGAVIHVTLEDNSFFGICKSRGCN